MSRRSVAGAVALALVVSVLTVVSPMTPAAAAGDTTKPTIVVGPLGSTNRPVGSVLAPTYSCDDDASGVASCTATATPGGPHSSGAPLDTSTPRTISYVVTAVDGAGNTHTVTLDFQILAVTSATSVTPIPGLTGRDSIDGLPFRMLDCPSASRCWVAERRPSSAGASTAFVDLYPLDAGALGAPVTVPGPAGPNQVLALSCPAVDDCTLMATSTGEARVTRFAAGAFGPTSVVGTPAAPFFGLDLDCFGATCTLVGQGVLGGQPRVAYATMTAGGPPVVAALATSSPPSTTPVAVGVDCVAGGCAIIGVHGSIAGPSSGFVTTVGSGGQGPAPLVSGAIPRDVACASLSSCLILADSVPPASGPTVIPFDAGVVGAPRQPAGGVFATLQTLECSPTATRCYAVGRAQASTASNGTSATVGVLLPVNDGAPGRPQILADSQRVNDVACGPAACIAEGYQQATSGAQLYHGIPLPVTDVAAPSLSISSPVDGAEVLAGQSLVADFTCADEPGGSGIASCAGIVEPSSVAVADGGDLPTGAAGSYTLTVTATDVAGNSSSDSVSYEVLAGSAQEEVTNGGTVSTGSEATSAAPVQTQVVAPPGTNGTIAIDPSDPSDPPGGFEFFGRELEITGPPATVADPYAVTFLVDSTALGGTAPADVEVFRNGVRVTGCTHVDDAVPDPCVAGRGFVPGGGGDAFVTVRTSHFSTWNLGVRIAPTEATALEVRPALIRRVPGLLGLHITLISVSARLTSGGVPLAGEPVRFSTGAIPLCSAVTDAQGVAACAFNPLALLPLILNGGVTARYAGDEVYLPSAGRNGLIG